MPGNQQVDDLLRCFAEQVFRKAEKETPVTRQLDAGSLSNVIAALEAKHPGMGERLLDDDGALRKFVNIFVDDDDVRYLYGLDTKVDDGWTVSIIPAVAGG